MSVSFLFMTEYNRISLSEVPLDLSHNCGKKKKWVEDIFEQNDTSDLRKSCSSIKKKKKKGAIALCGYRGASAKKVAQ